MLLTYKLIELIESNSDRLADSLLEKVRNSPYLREYSNVPPVDLRERVKGIYSNLGEWLETHKEQDIEARYTEIGARRAEQGVPLSQLNWTIVLTKENLWDFLKRSAVAADLKELSGELEMLQLLDQFFDRALYFAAVGYEKHQAKRAA
ncbi:MAG: hypothetical protein ACM3SW_08960 [Actinomycetota bacterium]